MKKAIIGLACMLGTMLCMAQAQDTASQDKNLAGKWSVRIDKYEDVWTFKEGGAVSSEKEPKLKGTWKKEDNCLLIQWDQVAKNGYRTWEAFSLPIKNNETQGGNWRGSKVTAKKI